MTIQRAMILAEKWANGVAYFVKDGEEEEYHKMFLNMLYDRKKAEKNGALPLGRLRLMHGDKIYIKFIGACEGFCDDKYAPYYGKHEKYVREYNGMLRVCDLPLKYYGKYWLAYRRKPEEG